MLWHSLMTRRFVFGVTRETCFLCSADIVFDLWRTDLRGMSQYLASGWPFSIHVLTPRRTERTRWRPRSSPESEHFQWLSDTASTFAALSRMWNSSLPWMQMLTSSVEKLIVTPKCFSASCQAEPGKQMLICSFCILDKQHLHTVFPPPPQISKSRLTSLKLIAPWQKERHLQQRGQRGRRQLGKKEIE